MLLEINEYRDCALQRFLEDLLLSVLSRLSRVALSPPAPPIRMRAHVSLTVPWFWGLSQQQHLDTENLAPAFLRVQGGRFDLRRRVKLSALLLSKPQ